MVCGVEKGEGLRYFCGDVIGPKCFAELTGTSLEEPNAFMNTNNRNKVHHAITEKRRQSAQEP